MAYVIDASVGATFNSAFFSPPFPEITRTLRQPRFNGEAVENRRILSAGFLWKNRHLEFESGEWKNRKWASKTNKNSLEKKKGP